MQNILRTTGDNQLADIFIPDAVGLRTISVLLNVHGVSLPHLKCFARGVAAVADRPWSELKLRVWNRRFLVHQTERGDSRLWSLSSDQGRSV